jgi:16S rRNA (cytidine1402-2'-O)-methyltransferase
VGRLIVVPTPIGNLEDITLRALRVLGEASLILAEDTRHTRKLLTHFDIHTRLLSYHRHNARSRTQRVLEALAVGDVALVSDAGMPGISDPGSEIIEAAMEAGVEVDVLPGPSAAPTAAVLAAFGAPGYLFAGFLPRTARERQERLAEINAVAYPIVLYEAPHRLVQTLDDLRRNLGDRPAVAMREWTKLHQEVVRGQLSALLDRFRQEAPRGEFTLVIGPPVGEPADRRAEAKTEMARLRERGEDRLTSINDVMATFGVSRNEAYEMWVKTEGGSGEKD